MSFFGKMRIFAPKNCSHTRSFIKVFMKNLFFFSLAIALTLTLIFCKNTPLPEGQTVVTRETSAEPPISLPASQNDTLPGFKGCERASWSLLSASSGQFLYQSYTVKINLVPNKQSEEIIVLPDTGEGSFTIPMPDDGHFHGICRNKLFVEASDEAGGRRFFIFDIEKPAQLYSTPYCGEPQIVESDRLHFLQPVDEKEVTKMPDCPNKEEWTKNGLRVGYGQRCIYNLEKRSLTRKSEWVCVPLPASK